MAMTVILPPAHAQHQSTLSSSETHRGHGYYDIIIMLVFHLGGRLMLWM